MSIEIILLSLLPGLLVGALALAAAARVRAERRALERQAAELAGGIAHVRAVEELARLAALSPGLDRLAADVGAIMAEAAGAARHAVFLIDEALDGGLRSAGGAAMPTARDASLLRGAIAAGGARMLDADQGAVLALPLRAREQPIGVLCLQVRPEDRGFDPGRVRSSERLAAVAAGLLDGAATISRMSEERRSVEQMAKLLVGREAKMRELKERLQGTTRL